MGSRDFKSFFNDASGGEGERCNYPTRLDTYGCGCFHNCNYCYARFLLGIRKNWNPDNPAVAPTDYISKKLGKVKRGTILRLGGMTDCFQPIERIYGATRQAIQMMNAKGIGYLIVTKSDLVADRNYLRILDPELAHVQISVTSTSDEPNFLGERATPPSRRMAAAKRLQDAGIDVQLRVSPYIPSLVEVGRLLDTGVRKCLVEFLRVNSTISGWLEEHGHATTAYTQSFGGYRHLPLWKKQSLIKAFEGFEELSVCEDVDEHYAYWKENVNHDREDCCNLRRP
jgi:DNA repair photolyase